MYRLESVENWRDTIEAEWPFKLMAEETFKKKWKQSLSTPINAPLFSPRNFSKIPYLFKLPCAWILNLVNLCTGSESCSILIVL